MAPFVDIHTHSDAPPSSEVVSVRSFAYSPGIVGELEAYPYPFTIGFHPWHLPLAPATALEELASLGRLPQCVAIGECGIDRLRGENLAAQYRAFDLQLSLAEKLHLPVIIHMVRSADDVLRAVARHTSVPAFIIHGFRGKREQARQLISKGLMLSFGSQSQSEAVIEAYAAGALFLETDEAKTSIKQIYEAACADLAVSTEDLRTHVCMRVREIFPTLLNPTSSKEESLNLV